MKKHIVSDAKGNIYIGVGAAPFDSFWNLQEIFNFQSICTLDKGY